MLLAMAQYFASNFTFFLCLSWMNPYLIERYGLTRETAAWCTMLVFLFGATAQWVAGFLTDALHRSRLQEHSRRIPAAAGFLLSAVAVAALPNAGTAATAVALFTVATFGAEMTISPSWSFCIDLGGRKSGAVSGSMNMVGNLGSFVSANAFPWLYGWTGSARAYFLVAAALNLVAALIWMRMRVQRPFPAACP
jgi:ACS family glucarate transporter-like MFS transporter